LATNRLSRPELETSSWTVEPGAFLDAIVDSSDDPIISRTLDGTILSWNCAASRVFGYGSEEIIGRSVLTLVPPDLQSQDAVVMSRVRSGERIERFETAGVRRNGERFPVSVTLSPIRSCAEEVTAVSVIVREISVAKRDEENRFRLAAIVESADDAIISKDLNGIIKSWNEAAHMIFGYVANEMIGQPILRLIPEELHYEEDEILSKLRAGQRIDHYETVRRRKNGERIDVSITVSPIKNEAGVVIGASKIARDISDKKRVARLVMQAEKMAATGRMAAAIAHEINNPLEALMNLIFLARTSSPEQSPVSQLLLTAEEELERVTHIARQTLGYYKDTEGPAHVHLHELLAKVLHIYGPRLRAKEIAIDTQFNDLQKIPVNRGEILQVFSNVIANAIDAMPQGGTLCAVTRTTSEEPGNGVEVVIKDNGSGIKTENLPRVFEPFFTTKGNLGTGIGLWVAKQIVEQHGGQITIASNATIGHSRTTVTMFIPFARAVTSSQ